MRQKLERLLVVVDEKINHQQCCLLKTSYWWASEETHLANIARFEAIKNRLLRSLSEAQCAGG